ncbi:MAG: hypothetical protein ACRDTX_18895 [Pseudonocardiaceae bacterium]
MSSNVVPTSQRSSAVAWGATAAEAIAHGGQLAAAIHVHTESVA